MHYEERRVGRSTKHYLAHSVRIDGRVAKVRVFLGSDLTRKQRAARRKELAPVLSGRVAEMRASRDPLRHALTKAEIGRLENLAGRYAAISGSWERKSRRPPAGSRQVPRSMTASAPVSTAFTEEEWSRFTTAFVYHTNAIEGSTVSLAEVDGILLRGDWPRGKSNWEIAETYGLAEAVRHVRKTRIHLSVELARELHRMIFRNSKPFAGRLRGRGVEVVVADSTGNVVHRGAPSRRVGRLLGELVAWYRENRRNYHPLILAAIVHNQFETIHPFEDGNGRVGRLLLNNILMRQGLPPVNIQLRNRARYYDALQRYQSSGDLRPTLELLLDEYGSLARMLRFG